MRVDSGKRFAWRSRPGNRRRNEGSGPRCPLRVVLPGRTRLAGRYLVAADRGRQEEGGILRRMPRRGRELRADRLPDPRGSDHALQLPAAEGLQVGTAQGRDDESHRRAAGETGQGRSSRVLRGRAPEGPRPKPGRAGGLQKPPPPAPANRQRGLLGLSVLSELPGFISPVPLLGWFEVSVLAPALLSAGGAFGLAGAFARLASLAEEG